MSTLEVNKEAVRRVLEEGISNARLDVLDELLAPDFTNHRTGLTNIARLGSNQAIHQSGATGPDGLKRGVGMLKGAFPDYDEVVEEIHAEGDIVWGRWSVSGTHKGPFLGLEPTGRRFTFLEVGMIRLRDGQLTEFWGMADELGLLEQLGFDIEIRHPSGMVLGQPG